VSQQVRIAGHGGTSARRTLGVTQEFPGTFAGGVLKNTFGAAVFHNHPIFSEVHNVADFFGKAHFVGYQHAGHALLRQFTDHRQHFADGFGVQRRSDLIEQDQLRAHRQRPGDCHPLLLTTGQLPRIRISLVLHAHLGQQSPGVLFSIDAVTPQHLARCNHQVFQHRQMREQVVLLKHKTHAFAQLDAVGFTGQGVDPGIAHPDLPALGLQQAGDATQDRRLAGAGRADDRHRLPRMDIKVDALEHRVAGE